MSERANHIGTIVGMVDAGTTLAGALLPQYRAYILLGAAVARQVPELYEDVVKLVQKQEPTAEEKVELWRKLRALANPEGV
jgi:1-aminocyclopropane-1-carboxylate deaminase/D-cysteine desulfhydrase-like pyridoxal-dependent ACC family enzyme